MGEFRVTITIADLGRSDEVAERCLDVLLERHATAGPVVTQTDSGELRLTVTVDATDPWAASNLAARVLGGSLDHAQIPPAPITDVTITALEFEDSSENVRELVRV